MLCDLISSARRTEFDVYNDFSDISGSGDNSITQGPVVGQYVKGMLESKGESHG